MKTDDAMRAEVEQTAAKFAARHIKPVAAETDHTGPRFPEEIFALGIEAGFDRFAISEEAGGHGFGAAELCALIETLARTCAGHAMVFGVHAAAVKAAIEATGGNAEITKLIFDARRPIGVAVPGPVGVNGIDISLKVVDEDEQNIYVSGEAGLAVNAVGGGLLIGFAESAAGDPTALLMSCDKETCALGEPEAALGLRAMPISEASFDRHAVPRNCIIASGSAAVIFYFSLLRNLCLVTSAAAAGTMEEAHRKAVADTAGRYQGGKMIIDHSHIRSIIGGMAAGVESSIGALYYAASKQYDDSAVIATKKTVTDNAVRVSSDAIQVHGGYGYMRDYGLEKSLRDSAVLSLFPISNERSALLLAAIGKDKL